MAITITASKRINRYSIIGWPDATNTGYTTTLTPASGAMSASTPGQIIENLDLTGNITVAANNVTIRNCQITSDAFWPIYADPAYAGTLIQDVTVIAGNDAQSSVGGRATIIRLNGSGGGDGLKLDSGSRVSDSYIHDLGGGPGAHNDGIEVNASDIQVIHSRILNSHSQTSGISIEPGLSDILIQDCYIAGGGYTLYGGNTTAVRVKIIGNTWGTDYYPDGGSFGPYAFQAPIGTNGNEWSGNTINGGPLT
jgi:hypothetical protein